MVAVGAAPPAPPVEASQTYAIRMHRPRQVGDRQHLSATASSVRKMVVRDEERVVRDEVEEIHVRLEATTRVLAVNEIGKDVSTAYTIERLTIDTPSGAREVLPAGRVVTIDRGKEKGTLRVDRGTLGEDAEKALREALSTTVSNVTDDEVFGTRERKAVGDRWPVDSRLAIADLASAGVRVAPASFQGWTKLVGVQRVGGETMLEVAAEMNMRDVALAALPPGTRIQRSTFEGRFHGTFPEDLTKRHGESSMRMRGSFQMTIPAGDKQVSMEMTMESEQRSVTSPAP
ncbi:Hypothetical protein A7982_01163 [Minicystis rosea]|nr:Hypothetical protein A7982_01163 [Minicystis rosea]